jgi:hypothetical protein
MAESTVVRVKRDGIITRSDSGAAHTYVHAYEPGDFAFNVPNHTVNLFLDRGEIGSTPSIRKGDDQPMTLTFSCYLRDIADLGATKTYTTPLDLSYRFASGYAATNWVSTLGSASDVPTETIQWTCDGSFCGEADKTLSFAYCFTTANGTEGDPTSVSISATSYALIPTVA